MEIMKAKFQELVDIYANTNEGMVFYTLADEPEVLPEAVHRFWTEQGCFTRDCTPDEVFSHVLQLCRTAQDEDGQTITVHDVAVVLTSDAPIDMGKLAMVKFMGPKASWISDYISNMRQCFVDEPDQVKLETKEILLRRVEETSVELEVPVGLEGYELAEWIKDNHGGCVRTLLDKHFRHRGYTWVKVVDEETSEEYDIAEGM